MNWDLFYHVVRKVLEKKYPWIKDVVITHDYDDNGNDFYGLEVHVDRKFKEEEVFMDKYEMELDKEVESMFNMMGPYETEKFDRVRIF